MKKKNKDSKVVLPKFIKCRYCKCNTKDPELIQGVIFCRLCGIGHKEKHEE